MNLHIAHKFTLPLDAVTQTVGILAKRRAGKSYTARRFTEQLHKAGQQVVIVDPKGDWWGIRSDADGKGPGLPVVILGGERGDVPLEVGSGEVISKLAAEERVSVLLDLSLFRKHQVATFMGEFLENLYRIKAREEFRTPLMLILDEADAIAPQKPYRGEERMLGATEDIVRRGGQRGIGCTMITQRSAVLNKNVLTQVQMLIALRTIAPQDLAALNAWVDVHGTDEQRKTLMDSLPALPTGDAWVWSPGWPTVEGIFQRVHVLPIETFDSGATPKPGQKRVEPKNVADVDLEALRKTMADTIERAKAEDPRELRREIAELQRANAELQRAGANSKLAKVTTKEVPVLTDAQIARIEKLAQRVVEISHKLDVRVHEMTGALGKYANMQISSHAPNPPSQPAADRVVAPPSPSPTTSRPQLVQAERPTAAGETLSGGMRRMMVALAQCPRGLSTKQIGVRAGMSSSSGTFGTYLGKLRSNGWAEGNRDTIRITQAGVEALGPYTPLPTGRELLAHWLGELGTGGIGRMLSTLADAYPQSLTKDEIGRLARVSPTSGTFGTYLGKLRTLELVTGGRELRASAEFFA